MSDQTDAAERLATLRARIRSAADPAVVAVEGGTPETLPSSHLDPHRGDGANAGQVGAAYADWLDDDTRQALHDLGRHLDQLTVGWDPVRVRRALAVIAPIVEFGTNPNTRDNLRDSGARRPRVERLRDALTTLGFGPEVVENVLDNHPTALARKGSK